MSFRTSHTNTNAPSDSKRHKNHLQISSDSLAESITTFRSTPDSSADSDDDNNSVSSLHGIDLEEQSTSIDQAVIQLGGESSPQLVTVNRASGLPPRSPANINSIPKSSSTTSPPPKMSSPDQRSLSKVSKMYDRTNKGYLDEQEQRMRELDKSNRGHLTNQQVYDILRESSEQNRRVATQRHLIIALGCFAFILALANMGTAFAAAYLAKDTEITPNGELASKDTHERVATTAKGYAFSLGNTILNREEDDGTGGRKLGLSFKSGMLNYQITSYNTIPKAQNAFMHQLLTSSSDTGMGTGFGTSLVRMTWACGRDGVGAQMSGIVESVEKIVYTNATGNGLNGTLFTYDIKIHGETQMVVVDCVDDDTVQDCAVDGTNCCVTNDDCGEGKVCNACGCQCKPDDGIMNRCDSSCEAGLGEAIIFRP